MFISSVLIYGLLAPLFWRMRATFSRFSPKLIFSPQSGKTFNDNSTKRNPLSAQCATLPEGESNYRYSAPLSPKAEVSYRHRVSLSPKEKAFPPSGKAFYFPTRLLNQNGRKTFSLHLNQNKRKDFL